MERGWYKTLTLEVEHRNQTLLMRFCASAKRSEKHCQNFKHCPKIQSGILRHSDKPIFVKCGFIRLLIFWFIFGFVSTF